MAFISEDRVDLLEEKLRSKIDTMTGFSDVEGKSRALEKVRVRPAHKCCNVETTTTSLHSSRTKPWKKNQQYRKESTSTETRRRDRVFRLRAHLDEHRGSRLHTAVHIIFASRGPCAHHIRWIMFVTRLPVSGVQVFRH